MVPLRRDSKGNIKDKKEDKRRRRLQQALQEGHRYILSLFMGTKERRDELLRGIVEKAKECRRLRRIVAEQQADCDKLTTLHATQLRRITKAETFKLQTCVVQRNAEAALDELMMDTPIEESEERIIKAQKDADEADARLREVRQAKEEIERQQEIHMDRIRQIQMAEPGSHRLTRHIEKIEKLQDAERRRSIAEIEAKQDLDHLAAKAIVVEKEASERVKRWETASEEAQQKLLDVEADLRRGKKKIETEGNRLSQAEANLAQVRVTLRNARRSRVQYERGLKEDVIEYREAMSDQVTEQLSLMIEAQHALLSFWLRNGMSKGAVTELTLQIASEHLGWHQEERRLEDMLVVVLHPPAETKEEIAAQRSRKAGEFVPVLDNLEGPTWDKDVLIREEWDVKSSTVQEYFETFTREERRGDSAPGTPTGYPNPGEESSTEEEEEEEVEEQKAPLSSWFDIKSRMDRRSSLIQSIVERPKSGATAKSDKSKSPRSRAGKSSPPKPVPPEYATHGYSRPTLSLSRPPAFINPSPPPSGFVSPAERVRQMAREQLAATQPLSSLFQSARCRPDLNVRPPAFALPGIRPEPPAMARQVRRHIYETQGVPPGAGSLGARTAREVRELEKAGAIPTTRLPGFWTDRNRKGGPVELGKLQDLAADTRFAIREMEAERRARRMRETSYKPSKEGEGSSKGPPQTSLERLMKPKNPEKSLERNNRYVKLKIPEAACAMHRRVVVANREYANTIKRKGKNFGRGAIPANLLGTKNQNRDFIKNWKVVNDMTMGDIVSDRF